MITVSVQTTNGAATTRAKVTATSIRRALEIAGGPARDARVVFPIDEREFFAADSLLEAGSANPRAQAPVLAPA